MLGSGFLPVLPWPTGHRVWVGPLRSRLEPAPQTHSPLLFHSPLLSLIMLLSHSLLSLTRSHFMYTVSQLLSQHCAEMHSVTLTYSPWLSFFVSLMLSCSHAHHLTPASSAQSHANMQASSHAHSGMDHIDCTPPFRYSSSADVMLAYTFYFYGATFRMHRPANFTREIQIIAVIMIGRRG